MRVIKLALISILALFVVMCFFSLMMPSTVIVSRAVDINAPADSIKLHVSDLQQWVYWVKGMNSKAVNIKSATAADLGRQQLTIESVTDSTVVSSWSSTSSSTQISTIRFIKAPQRNLTIVQWQFVQKLKWYPWEKFGSFMNDKILGPMMEQNLQNLKLLSEHQQVQIDNNPAEIQ
jgi:thiamine kinase-like enzyme